MKIFEKLSKKHGFILSSNKFSELRRDELYSIVKHFRDEDILTTTEYISLKNYTYRYNSQTTKELASNLYKWCKKYL